MAAKFLEAKDWVSSKVTPDCLKSNIDEVKKKIGTVIQTNTNVRKLIKLP